MKMTSFLHHLFKKIIDLEAYFVTLVLQSFDCQRSSPPPRFRKKRSFLNNKILNFKACNLSVW
jgi:hypothetical protein